MNNATFSRNSGKPRAKQPAESGGVRLRGNQGAGRETLSPGVAAILRGDITRAGCRTAFKFMHDKS